VDFSTGEIFHTQEVFGTQKSLEIFMRQGSLMAKFGVAVAVGAVSLVGMPIAQAADLGLPAGTIGLQTVPGRFVSVQNVGRSNLSDLTLAFNLGTCVDNLLPVSYTTEKRGNQLFVYVSGINARGDASAVSCTPGPYVARAKLRVLGTGYNANTIKVMNLTQLGTVVR
jgi:hypothetical protein